MLFALGAASAAVDAIKSLTSSKPSSSQPIGFGPAPASASDNSTAPSGGSTAVSGFTGGPQMSPDTISVLLDAQTQSTGVKGSNANALPPAPTTSSSAASSTYSAIDQLIQRQQANAVPLAINPFSVNV
jgi:hypothetical protein